MLDDTGNLQSLVFSDPRAHVKWSGAPSLGSLLVVDEKMSSSRCP